MDMTSYLLAVLGLSMGIYLFYRLVFLKNPKQKHKTKPHFTFKIETE
ncbi:MAG: hypothetical protein AB7U44_00155 [Sulfuricurvum sp.]|nr:hypothetical protein [Sulfuricurvum sp.]MDD2838939.1 hypothetical protein [Sulfuricurvum sp.]MDD3595978.1 hypothetical protein [Sulfuricurvum sp.]MDD4883603.1 hypothetical protein [Sulfuricurvum sp.]